MNDLFSPSPSAATAATPVRIGIGGWSYIPWRGGRFYPAGLVQRRELEYASRQLNSIEINSTYYGTQKPATYARWAEETPPGFVFSAKAPQRITASRRLASTAVQVDDFIAGISALGDRLGPLLWQFDAGQRLQRDDFAAFLERLPDKVDGRRQRHALEIRDPALLDAALLALVRARGLALVYTDSPDYPNCADLSADFVYARLMRSRAEEASGYPEAELGQWARRIGQWRVGGDPPELPHIAAASPDGTERDVFVYFISAAKAHNPAAAMALQQRLGRA